MGLRKGGKLLTKNSFGDELNALMKRLPGEPNYSEFKQPGDVEGSYDARDEAKYMYD